MFEKESGGEGGDAGDGNFNGNSDREGLWE